MRYWAVLLAILTLAAVLRFAGLSWGLRHRPTWDERVFVHSTRAMIAQGDLDHRYYEYPGLFFYLLTCRKLGCIGEGPGDHVNSSPASGRVEVLEGPWR